MTRQVEDIIKLVLLIINILLFLIIVIASIVTRNYEKDFIKNEDSKELKFPFALWLVDKFDIANRSNDKIKSSLANLKLYNNVFDVVRMHYCKKISLCIAVILVCNIFCIADYVEEKETKSNIVDDAKRPDYGKADEKVSLDVNIDGKKTKKIVVDLPARTLDEDEREKLFKNVYSYAKKKLLGKNKSLDSVTKKLVLAKTYPKDENVKISWLLDEDSYVDEKGYVENIDKKVNITMIITYLDYRKEHMIPLTLKKHTNYDDEAVVNKIHKEIDKQNKESSDKKNIELPKDIDGVNLNYTKSNNDNKNTSFILFFLGIVAVVAIVISKDKEIESKMKERNESLILDYTKLLNKFALLLSAGFTIRKSWEKICFDASMDLDIYDEARLLNDNKKQNNNKVLLYKNEYVNANENFTDKKKRNSKRKISKNKRRFTKDKKRFKKREKKHDLRFIYGEMIYTLNEMYSGKSEVDAYEDFAKRVGLIQYTKLCSLFIQSIVSGVPNIVDILEIESLEAQKDKTECVKQCGRKIGTKMLFPMMGLLFITIIMVIIPVLLSAF